MGGHHHHQHPGFPGLTLTHSHDGTTHTHEVGPQPRLHLRGVVLPAGDECDLWVCDGVIRTEPVGEAIEVKDANFILPGLVDAHCHIGLDKDGAVPPEVAEQQALTDRDAGTLLIRDAGSPADTRWIDERDDLPRIIRAGRHIARPKRYIRNYAAEVEPAALVTEVRRQARRGDGWVKLVGDWIDREVGDLAPLWEPAVAAAAITAAHEEGARVTAHCFGEESVADLVRAGIDGIEHGTGLDDATIELMAERGVALVPTLVNIENFPGIAAAGQARFPRYAAHMSELYARRFETIGKAREAGVPVFAGTDAGGTVAHGVLASEIELLGRVGDSSFALGAASWRARSWLGADALIDGAPADLVAFSDDPRRDLRVTRAPRLVILRGRVVRDESRSG